MGVIAKFSCVYNGQIQYRLVSNDFYFTSLITSLAVLLATVNVKGNSDFRTLGADEEDLLAGQSSSFFLRKEYSLIKPYQGSWSLSGSAAISGDDFVRLTSGQQSQRGAIVNRLPVHIQHWEVRVQFRVHGPADSGCGDGFAFWYAEVPEGNPGEYPRGIPRGFPGQLFGGPSRFRGLAVTLDTYSNAHGPQLGHFHPYISALVNNGSLVFTHDDDGELKEPTGCTVRFRNRQGETHMAIRYVDNQLIVSTRVEDNDGGGLAGDAPGSWRRCFRIRGLRLPTHLMFGFSAMTGDLVDNHDILAAKVYEVESTQSPDDYSGNRRLIVPAIDLQAKHSAEFRTPPLRQSASSMTGSSDSTFAGHGIPTWLALLAAATCLTGLAWYRCGMRWRRGRSRFY